MTTTLTRLNAILPNRSGLAVVQMTKLCNTRHPNGKAFYSTQMGGAHGLEDRAVAATLALDPSQRTFEHEIRHALFLSHTFQIQEESDPNFLHQHPLPTGGVKNCIMHYQPTNYCDDGDFFFGFCILKLWGWSFLQTDAADAAMNLAATPTRTIWYNSSYNQEPRQAGTAPGAPTRPPGRESTIPRWEVPTRRINPEIGGGHKAAAPFARPLRRGTAAVPPPVAAPTAPVES
jgi:hypothetical protein